MDLRVEKTYKLLTSAFEALLEEKLVSDITVKELCERAMVRRATFYAHFADKNDFLRFYVRGIREGIGYSVTQKVPEVSFRGYARQMTLGFSQIIIDKRRVLDRLRLDRLLPSCLTCWSRRSLFRCNLRW